MRLVFSALFMPSSFARKAAICFCWGLLLALPAAVSGQTNYYTTNGTEYAVAGQLPGDQVWPDVALGASGGFVVWQDNATDGSGWGISATRLDSTLSAVSTWSDVRVNITGTNDQENARVALLKNGGAVFVWQGGVKGYQHIYARFLSSSNSTFVFLTTTDVVVSVPTNNFQINPAVAVLNNSNVVVVWGSFDEAGSSSLQDVYGQMFSQTGQKIGGEFLINQFASYNQRDPAVSALAGGGFVVAWVSEQERSLAPDLGVASTNTSSLPTYVSPSGIATPSVDIYARLYNSSGTPVGGEFPVDTGSNPCANPAVAAASDGTFMVVWGARDTVNLNNDWDIYARPYSSAGVGGVVEYVNTTLYGDQYAPRISSIGTDYMVMWTSLGQDGSREGVYGQFVHADGGLVGGEFRVNTTTIGQQMQPAVSSDGTSQFMAVWTSSPGYAGTPSDFDLFAQRYINVNLTTVLPTMNAPFVWAPFTLSNGVYQPQLQVAWSSLSGVAISNYEVYADGTNSPTAAVTSNQWMMTAANGLTTNSTHGFQVGYVTTSGRQSPLSAATTNSTWSGLNWGGIPYEWMAAFYGGYFSGKYHTNNWPSAGTVIGTGGITVYQVFLMSGGSMTGVINPLDSTTWLQAALAKTSQGFRLNWWPNVPGHTYQVMMTTNFTSWSAVGSPQPATDPLVGATNSINVGNGSSGFYRVLFLY